uniref:Uncharacterized protein n=1 Tax=viral metagenome TaxID=1070528 RepID=A0A6C0IGK8_9ZZZZ
MPKYTEEYIKSVYNIFQMVNKIPQTESKKTKYIALLIFKYIFNIAKNENIDLKTIEEPEYINLVPFFEYVTENNIDFFDFKNINESDIDVSKPEDVERFILSHIYYITQK